MADIVGLEGSYHEGNADPCLPGSVAGSYDMQPQPGQTMEVEDSQSKRQTDKDPIMVLQRGDEGVLPDEHNEGNATIGSAGDSDNNNHQPIEKKPRKDNTTLDDLSVDTRLSGKSGDSAKLTNDSFSSTGSRPTSAASSRSPMHKEKDPAKKEKDKEREERLRQHREKIAEERQKKIDELREQQRIAQELREKQLELRRHKIDELRRREEERRAAVEERRLKREEEEKTKREAILEKAKERLGRYEMWKASGRKGMFPGCSPPSKHLSVSTSVLYHKRKPEFSSSGALNTTSRQDSLLAPGGVPPTRPKSTVNLNAARLRDNKLPRKPRPASIAGSMPSFVHLETPGSATTRASRSKSTDRLARSTEKKRVVVKEESTPEKVEEKKDIKKKFDLKKVDEKKKTEEKKNLQEKKKAEDKSNDENGQGKTTPSRVSKSTIDRLSTPKQMREKAELMAKPEITANKENTPVLKSRTPKDKDKKDVPTEKKKTSEQQTATQEQTTVRTPSPAAAAKTLSPVPPEIEEKPPVADVEPHVGDLSPSPRTASPASSMASPPRGPSPTPQTLSPQRVASPPRVMSPPRVASPTPRALSPKPLKPEASPAPASKSEQKPSTPAAKEDAELEEYKAKLAEKRRQAREKAEREAELERQRQEEIRRLEEERQQREEEEQRRLEEETLRLAREAQQAEEERFQKAIEAEEQRKREEAERLEEERKAREEAEKKAKEEADRLELERQERKKKDEEERLERKKRLEMIMKRVKTDTASAPEGTRTDSPTKSLTSSPSKSSIASNDSSCEDKGDDVGVTMTTEDKKPAEKLETPAFDTPKFRSPLLQKLAENKVQNGGGESPKFKSPLLQNLLGKSKSSSRIVDKSDDSGSDTKESRYQVDSGDENRAGSSGDELENINEPMHMGVIEQSDVNRSYTDSGMFESVDSSDSRLGVSGTLVNIRVEEENKILPPFNGISHHWEGEEEPSRELIDSSISMKTVDSLGTSTTDASLSGSLFESQSAKDNEFEEIIDLSVTNRTLEGKSGDPLISTTDDLLNFNSLDNSSSEGALPKPIIAFEDNTPRRQDVTDLLS